MLKDFKRFVDELQELFRQYGYCPATFGETIIILSNHEPDTEYEIELNCSSDHLNNISKQHIPTIRLKSVRHIISEE